MPDLLLETFGEEIPARMQAQAADELRKRVTEGLVARGLLYEGAKAFATPRRLALAVGGLPATQPDVAEERKGPRVGAPQAAIDGFLKAAGLTSISQAQIVSDGKKGEIYVARATRKGRPTLDVLAEIIPAALKDFPWPKSMRWGAASASPEAPRWVRPLHSIVATFGTENEPVEIVPFAFAGIASGAVTRGHRFMAPAPFAVRRLEDYAASLRAAKVEIDPERRREAILADARALATAHGLDLVEDEALLAEVAGLVEWPVTLIGSFDSAFLDIPEEVIRATIRANQKCFVLRDAQTRRLADRFVMVANLEASDGGAAIVAGNQRVVAARLADALHFWTLDRKPLPGRPDDGKPLDQRLAKLREQNVVFHAKLGTQGERVDRIMRLAEALAGEVDAYPALARRAAELAKADLTTEIVGEFPETQGLMGARYAALQGEDPAVAAAIEEHYKPQGPGDRTPTAPVSVAVALADKLDTLAGFWSIDEKPTGSKDPYALRRAALGVIRIVLENGLELPLFQAIHQALAPLSDKVAGADRTSRDDPTFSLRQFLIERLKVALKDQGKRHDLIDAAAGADEGVGHIAPTKIGETDGDPTDDLLKLVRRVEALGAFLDDDDGRNLLAGTKRAANILAAEAKKEKVAAFDGDVDPTLLKLPEERALLAALSDAERDAKPCLGRDDYVGVMKALAKLRAPVDSFFDKVTVNDPDPALRLNRLRLLEGLREATLVVADFSRVAG